MDNIQIKRTPLKRNIQSLIEQSSFDISPNHNNNNNNILNLTSHQNNSPSRSPPNPTHYQLHQLRQAYTKTIRSQQQKLKTQQKIITKLQLENNQKNQIISQLHRECVQREKEVKEGKQEKQNIMKENQKMRKRLGYLQYKREIMQGDRKRVMKELSADAGQRQRDRAASGGKNQYDYDSNQEIPYQQPHNTKFNPKISKQHLHRLQKQIYNKIHQIINTKITKFIPQLQKYPMNNQLQYTIQSFLQNLLYITPIQYQQQQKSIGIGNSKDNKMGTGMKEMKNYQRNNSNGNNSNSHGNNNNNSNKKKMKIQIFNQQSQKSSNYQGQNNNRLRRDDNTSRSKSRNNNSNNNRKIGKISTNTNPNLNYTYTGQKISDYQQWHKLQKSTQKFNNNNNSNNNKQQRQRQYSNSNNNRSRYRNNESSGRSPLKNNKYYQNSNTGNNGDDLQKLERIKSMISFNYT